MAFEYFIGNRYLITRKKQTFISLITFLSTAGVAVGVMVMIVVIAVMSGAESELRSRMLGITAHAVILRHGGEFTNYSQTLQKLRQTPDVTAATPYIFTQVMLRSASAVTGVVLRGIDPATAGTVIRSLDRKALDALNHTGQSGKAVPGIVLGKELANLLGVAPGKRVSLIIPGGGIAKLPTVRQFQVVDTFESGLYEFDKGMAYATLSDVQRILQVQDAVSGIEIRVNDIYRAGEISQRAAESLGHEYWGQDWMRMNRNIFSALKLQKTVMFIILALIVLVAAFNIASTLIMMVMGKTGDIAILKAMGATDRSIRKIFVYKGMAIGTVGTLLGTIGGFILSGVLKRYHFIELPKDVYFFTTLPVSLEFLDVIVIVLSTLAVCYVSTLYPARRAARYNPVEAFRYG
ncbi:lipoprotein-releasing ABC transporter permease subunit [Desulfococcus multivorans]|uniref:Lipoprotein releasing system, transmembrane protein, LolC/E family n=1 Tax=Desulfococcus multivorans DSM 2059 TaxID=1121405 RepID=S7U6L4_DESML|nr:lipoprotein-releasing ABC transporter permease subunit [Desulfococcus multivorans]AOY59185.1 LolC: lipoprotein-releasing system transmembrane protein [Desulfococcus multivorans]AQV01412.1 ABC transporter permease [Desulfococcus multivorans]EPR44992.1 lipoprotein releasing system, transmembrane protein, LolC/E family [Desulfococcus multivorans DSM 2059]SJZ85167.1 lipoprotein-releasing system permease protein [Desulfococcus multivorans DSM 2059]